MEDTVSQPLKKKMPLSYYQYPLFRGMIAFSLLVTLYLYVRISNLQQQRRDSITPKYIPHHRNRPTEIVPRSPHPLSDPKQKATNDLGNHGLPQHGSIPQVGLRVTLTYTSTNADILVELNRDTMDVPTYWDTLPKCSKIKQKGSDNIAFDTLRSCGKKEQFSFEVELEAWLHDANVSCAGRFIGFSKDTAALKDVVVDRSKCSSKLFGGEILDELLQGTHSEMDEYCQLQSGFFMLPCDHVVQYGFRGASENYLNSFVGSLTFFNESLAIDDVVDTPTIAIVRFEYYNIYHTMAEIYNVFLATVFMRSKPKNSNVLFIDAHPRDAFDNVWKRLFHSARRVNELSRRTLYYRIFWAMPGHSSYLLNFSRGSPPPYLEEFNSFIRDGFKIKSDMIGKDCKYLRVLFIWREDYVSNLRNPSGNVGRKISNELELLRTLRSTFPTFTFTGIHLEALHFKTQLHKISRTDILIGMHGAGLTHSLFLPKHAGIIELIPGYFHSSNEHFKGFSQWRGLKYLRWTNIDPENDNKIKESTRVPPSEILQLVEQMVKLMCPL